MHFRCNSVKQMASCFCFLLLVFIWILGGHAGEQEQVIPSAGTLTLSSCKFCEKNWFGQQHGCLVTRLKANYYPFQPYWLEPKKERNRHTRHRNKKIKDTKIDEDVKREQGRIKVEWLKCDVMHKMTYVYVASLWMPRKISGTVKNEKFKLYSFELYIKQTEN